MAEIGLAREPPLRGRAWKGRTQMSPSNGKATREDVVKELIKSYNMELETVVNYLANSLHLDGVRAMEIRESLEADVTEELGHAQRLGQRIKELFGAVPGSQELKMEQTSLQPPKDSIDVVKVIKGVIEAEQGAIKQYKKLVEMTDGIDPVTQDLCVELQADEEGHRRLFIGFLKEYEDVSQYVDAPY